MRSLLRILATFIWSALKRVDLELSLSLIALQFIGTSEQAMTTNRPNDKMHTQTQVHI